MDKQTNTHNACDPSRAINQVLLTFLACLVQQLKSWENCKISGKPMTSLDEHVIWFYHP